MNLALNIAQIVVVILLIVCILLQQRGSGLGAAFGGDGGNAYATKRGAERIIFISTIILSVLFLGLALTNFLLQ